MTHSPHHTADGYSPDQVLYDDCAECDGRAKRDDHGLANLDNATFERAWQRAADWERKGLADMARNEAPLFRMLVAVMVKLENRGLPFGYLPRGEWKASPVEAAAPGLLEAYMELEGDL